MDRDVLKYVQEHEEALTEAKLTFQTSSDSFEVVAPIEKLTTVEPAEERMHLEQKAELRTHNPNKLDKVFVYKALHDQRLRTFFILII